MTWLQWPKNKSIYSISQVLMTVKSTFGNEIVHIPNIKQLRKKTISSAQTKLRGEGYNKATVTQISHPWEIIYILSWCPSYTLNRLGCLRLGRPLFHSTSKHWNLFDVSDVLTFETTPMLFSILLNFCVQSLRSHRKVKLHNCQLHSHRFTVPCQLHSPLRGKVAYTLGSSLLNNDNKIYSLGNVRMRVRNTCNTGKHENMNQ